MPKLGVNIDHVATLRQARRGLEPDPVSAAQICAMAGADSIVAHLREDRRHMQDKDIHALRKSVKGRFNLEMSLNEEIIQIALKIKPDQVTLVPERRQEITTEGGLDVIRHFLRIKKAVCLLQRQGIEVSLFIDPQKDQVNKTLATGAKIIELHTGQYALAKTKESKARELKKICAMTEYAFVFGLTVNAGHGLNYENTKAIARIPKINELNIGHSIISRAVFVGLENAVKEMKEIL